MACDNVVVITACSSLGFPLEKETNSICVDPPSVVATILSASVVAVLTTDCVKYIGKTAQELCQPGSRTDAGIHIAWAMFAIGSVPASSFVAAAIVNSSDRLGPTSHQPGFILSITVASWIVYQALDVVLQPLIYVVQRLTYFCLQAKLSSHSRNQNLNLVIRPVEREHGVLRRT